MPPSSTSRREFIAGLLAGVAALAVAPHRRGESCAHRRSSGGPHPTPRPGIDASRVLGRQQLKDTPAAIAAFDEVRQIPQIVDGIRCYCGCATSRDFYSLLSCYEGEGMARTCEMCQGEGRMAFRLHRKHKSLDEIRAAIDARYG